MIAYLEASRAGLLRREHWLPNIVSGVIVGVVALPLAMAFAIASGAKPQQGLYTAIVAGGAGAFFGRGRGESAGAAGAVFGIPGGVTGQNRRRRPLSPTLMCGAVGLFLAVGGLGW